jgi:hypothetical protein
MRDHDEARPAAVLAVVLDQSLHVVAAVGRPGRDAEAAAGRDLARQLVAGAGPDAAYRLRQIGRARRGERITFGARVGSRQVTCTAEPLSVAGTTATHVLIMVDDAAAEPSAPGGRGPVRDRARHLDEGDYDVLTQLAGGRTQTSIAATLRLTRRGLDHRVARLRRNLGETSLTLTGLVASTYAAGILVSDAWPPRISGPLTAQSRRTEM